jgi:hypothetical protein
MDSQQPAGSTVRAAGAARRLLGGCCEVLCSQRPAQLAQHGTSSQQAALGSRGGAGRHQIVSQPDQGVSVLLYLRNHGKHVDRIDLSGICIIIIIKLHLASQVPCAKATIQPWYQNSTTRRWESIAAPQGLCRMWPRHNIHGAKTTAQNGCSRTAPHMLLCSFETNHCSRISKDLWSASRSVAPNKHNA